MYLRSNVPEVQEPGMTQVSLYKEILYTESEVDARIAAMAVDIARNYGSSGISVGNPGQGVAG